MGEVARISRSSSCCSKGRRRRGCRSCASCTGSSRPIRRPRRTSRGSSTRRPAAAQRPPELWRYTSPYRGLEAMEEKDSDYFFGRERETVEVLERARSSARPAAGADRQFGRRQILARAGRRAGGAQASGLARARRRRPGLAGGLSEQPAVVLSHAEARRRADQGAGRVLPRRLAIRRDRSRAGEQRQQAGSSCCDGKATLVRPDRRHRAPPRGTRSAQAAGLLSLRRSGRGALRARRGAPAPALLRTPGAGAARPAPARDDEHALRLPRRSAKRRAAVQGAPADRRAAAAARRSCARW